MPRAIPTIGIDGSRLAIGERTGTETYTHQLLSAMSRLQPDDSIEIYYNAREMPRDAPLLGKPIYLPFKRFWTHGRLSWRMQRRPPGVLFVPAHVIPIRHPASVVTIHDLGYLHFPDTHPASTRCTLDLTTRWSARVAKRIIAISDVTRRDLITSYGVPDDRIQVIPHGVSAGLRRSTPDRIASVRAKLSLPERYVLFVGTVQPRKNLGRLAAAMAVVADAGLPHHLVIAGKSGWLSNGVDDELRISGLSERIHRLGYVEDDDLPAIYSGADVFCLPSLYEGFGMPVLEAMACGTAVVASNTSALPEVTGNAAVLVDPTDVRGIGNALVQIINDESRRKQFVNLGIERAGDYTWERTAAETLALLREVRDGRLTARVGG